MKELKDDMKLTRRERYLMRQAWMASSDDLELDDWLNQQWIGNITVEMQLVKDAPPKEC